MSRRYPAARLRALAGVSAFLLLAVVLRLGQLQLVEGERWRQRAETQTLQERDVLARRGALLDRNGHPLAHTEQAWEVGITSPARWRERPRRQEQLARLTGRPVASIRRLLQGRDSWQWVSRAAYLPPAIVDSLGHLPDLAVDPVLRRRYDVGDVAARVLGTMKEDKAEGVAGVELMLDELLSGKDGRELVRYDGGATRDEIIRTPLRDPQPGADVELTLDLRLQMILEEELDRATAEAGAWSGVGILVDPWSGEVLALADSPGRARDARGPWAHPGAVHVFEPGSTFKLFTYASLFANAVADTSDRFDGEAKEGDRRTVAKVGALTLRDVHPVQVVSLRHAFVVSSNIITGKAVGRLEAGEFHADLQRFGFGQRTGSGWPSESVGIFRDVEDWSGRSQPTLSIGQEISVTLLQLAAGYSALVTDGTLRSPRFVRAWTDADGERRAPGENIVRKRVVPPGIIPLLRQLCREAVQQPYGSGVDAAVEGLDVGGKTGTGEIWGEGRYLGDRFTASFVGFAPAQRPRLLGAIVLHGARGDGRFGGTSAAPAFGRVLRQVMATTEWLEAGPATAEARSAGTVAPRLVGRSAEGVLALAAAAGLSIATPPPAPGARVVGQLPPAGSRMDPATPLQLAWALPPEGP